MPEVGVGQLRDLTALVVAVSSGVSSFDGSNVRCSGSGFGKLAAGAAKAAHA